VLEPAAHVALIAEAGRCGDHAQRFSALADAPAGFVDAPTTEKLGNVTPESAAKAPRDVHGMAVYLRSEIFEAHRRFQPSVDQIDDAAEPCGRRLVFSILWASGYRGEAHNGFFDDELGIDRGVQQLVVNAHREERRSATKLAIAIGAFQRRRKIAIQLDCETPGAGVVEALCVTLPGRPVQHPPGNARTLARSGRLMEAALQRQEEERRLVRMHRENGARCVTDLECRRRGKGAPVRDGAEHTRSDHRYISRRMLNPFYTVH
jgi:hypothetical protein